MGTFLALVAFAFVNCVTPGPNNILLWAAGAEFGLRRTVPHIVGTALGIGLIALAAAAGLAALVTAVPGLAVAMKVGGSLYLLVLATRIAAAGGFTRRDIARPFGLIQAAAFQAVNAKGWIFALGAVTTFRPPELTELAGSLVVAATMMAMVLPTATLWAAAGGAISRLLTSERRRRVVSVGLAALVAATVVSVWV